MGDTLLIINWAVVQAVIAHSGGDVKQTVVMSLAQGAGTGL